ncbi:MAG: ABC transporter permease [Haloferacaceae archaeon]
MSNWGLNRRSGILAGGIVALGLVVALVPGLRMVGLDVVGVVDASYVRTALRLTVPIAFAGMGGIFAEKSGVINIGLEGLLIIAAFTAIATTWFLGGGSSGGMLIAFLVAVLASTFVAFLFAAVCIEFEADQIIAGLAVWLIALGLAPFGSIIIWETVNSPSTGTLDRIAIPVLSELPYLGPAVFDATPPVYLLFVAVPFSWYLLNRTAFGKHLRASGEDPKTLDTVGVDVRKIRYAGVLLSGVYCGIGGAGLALNVGQFVGGGETMIGGRGWIGITTYLIGNYNPIGAALAAFFFAGLNALQLELQRIAGIEVSSSLIGIIPYVAVLVVLTFVGRTRMPGAAGEHYDPDE